MFENALRFSSSKKSFVDRERCMQTIEKQMLHRVKNVAKFVEKILIESQINEIVEQMRKKKRRHVV